MLSTRLELWFGQPTCLFCFALVCDATDPHHARMYRCISMSTRAYVPFVYHVVRMLHCELRTRRSGSVVPRVRGLEREGPQALRRVRGRTRPGSSSLELYHTPKLNPLGTYPTNVAYSNNQSYIYTDMHTIVGVTHT